MNSFEMTVVSSDSVCPSYSNKSLLLRKATLVTKVEILSVDFYLSESTSRPSTENVTVTKKTVNMISPENIKVNQILEVGR